MRFSEKRREEIQLDITSLIDVVFLLLLFFMVSSTFDRYSQIKLRLPEASPHETPAKINRITVGVDAEGHVYVNGHSLVNTQILTIKQALSEAVQGLKEPPIIIEADAKATHQSVIRVMDAAQQLGLVQITFLTQTPE